MSKFKQYSVCDIYKVAASMKGNRSSDEKGATTLPRKKGDLQTARMCGCADGWDGRKMEIRRSGPVPDKTRKIGQRCQLLCNLAYAHSGLASD
jgi:hypothetical protein